MRVLTTFLLFAITAFAFTQFGASAKTVRYRTIASGTYSTFTKPDYRTAADIGVLENYWTQFLRQGGSIPMVDFTKDRVAIFFLGQRSSGGYAASVRGIYAGVGATAQVVVQESTPAEGSMNTMALTQPWVMVAVDRSYIDFNLSFTKVQAPQPLPWIATGPTSSFLPTPWVPCFTGYGGNWATPCGYLFDDWSGFSQWGYQNDLNFDVRGVDVNWGTQRLACVSAGRFGLGFDLRVLGVNIRGGIAYVQMSRSVTTRGGGSRAPFTTIAVQRSVQQIQVELVDSRSNCFVNEGNFNSYDPSVIPVQGIHLLNSARKSESYFGKAYTNLPDSVKQFNYRTGQVVVANLGTVNRPYRFEGVVYRGAKAVLQFSAMSTSGNLGAQQPYYVIRVDPGTTSVGIEEVQARTGRR